jgi:hypothetical protein
MNQRQGTLTIIFDVEQSTLQRFTVDLVVLNILCRLPY